MGWFFGCFGGSGKKDRKQKTFASPLPKQQKPLQYAAPSCKPAAVSSSISVKAAPHYERPSHEDLFTVRQVSCSAPLQNIQRACLQNAPTDCQDQEKLPKPGPWFCLDDLEEELEALRKQIDKESKDTKTLKEEVSIFKSCGTHIKTPSELNSPWEVDDHQGSMLEGGRRSWLAPSASPNKRNSPVNRFQFDGLKAALCEPTPTKECHSLLLGIQTPVSSTRVSQSSDHQSTGAQVLEEQVDRLKNGDILDTKDDLLLRQGSIKLRLPADLNPPQKSLSMSNPCLDDEGIHMRGECFDIELDALIPKPKGILKQGNRPMCGMENKSSAYEDNIEIEKNSAKKRRLGMDVATLQPPYSLKKPIENNASSLQDYDASCQKRLRTVSPGEQSTKEPHANPLPVQFLRCKSLSPIIESGTSIEASTRYQEEPSRQLCSYNSMPQVSSQSPASQTKSSTLASTNDEDYTTDELSYHHGAVERYSDGSYMNEEDEDGSATPSCSSSTDSEETLSDLSPEHRLSPLVSPSHAKSSSIYRSQDDSAITHGVKAAKSHSMSSTQYSSVYGGMKKQHAHRYESEEDDASEDDHDLYTDAMSHVSTECSDAEPRRWHGRAESTDSVSAHFAHLGHTTDLNLIDTPPKLAEGLATPNIDIPVRLRSKPASSVLTPVENMSQWKQLKERDQKVDVSGTKAGNDEPSKADFRKRAEGPKLGIQDENENLAWTPSKKSAGKQLASQQNPTSDAKAVNVNASSSHWGFAPKVESILLDASLSQWGTATAQTEHIRVDMSLSHWLGSSSKLNEAHKATGTSTISTSSGEGDVVSPAPKLQAKDYRSPNSAMRAVKSQLSSYVASERPIVGGGDGPWIAKQRLPWDGPSRNAKQRSPWDGKGTPNSTAKYMEDQRVKWHATPFDQRLEKALDKQGILLQKKLFGATPAAAVL